MPEHPSRPLRVLVIDGREGRSRGHRRHARHGPGSRPRCRRVGRLDLEPAIDLVLTDLRMPGMSGWEVARAVKARRLELPVGLVTGWATDLPGRPEDRQAIDFILAKPLTTASLRAALSRATTIR